VLPVAGQQSKSFRLLRPGSKEIDSFVLKNTLYGIPINKYVFFLNGKKRDLNRLYISRKNIKEITVELGRELTMDTSLFNVLNLKTNSSLKFLSLTDLLKKHGLIYDSLNPYEIEIDGKQILDTLILIDSDAMVFPVYRKIYDGQQKAHLKPCCASISMLVPRKKHGS
jgi:hypothetical protein